MSKEFKGILAKSRLKKEIDALEVQNFGKPPEEQEPDLGFIERQFALYEHYSLPHNPEKYGHDLAMAMAADLVPGFKVKESKAGAPGVWKADPGTIFYIKVQLRILNKPQISQRQAVRDTAQEMDRDVSTENKLNSIYARYQESKNKNQAIRFYKTFFEPEFLNIKGNRAKLVPFMERLIELHENPSS